MKVVERRDATESLESVSLSTNPAFLRLIERSRARHREEGGVSSEEMRRKLGRPASGEGA